MLTTPDTIRTLQRKLYAKAKQEPAYRFYALYDKLYRADILSHAWRLVKANKGSPGVDGISFEAIENGIGVDTLLRELAQDLKDKTYRAQAVRRVMIPKGDGSLRPLGIPTIRDRVAQMAVNLIIEPICAADFRAHSLWMSASEIGPRCRGRHCQHVMGRLHPSHRRRPVEVF